MGQTTDAPFKAALFHFLLDLKANNDRAWFQAQKARYETDARNPMLAFIAGFSAPLAKLGRNFSADPRPVGGSMFRLHRDTRFSKDKTPYKTHLAAHFPYRNPAAGGVHGPGFYLHLEPDGSFAGGGLWHPEPDSLFKVRQAIAARPRAWKAIRDSGLEIQGDALKRVPQGFPPDHPWAEDLKRKDFYIGTRFSDAQVLAPDFLEQFTAACSEALPLVKFLCKALDLPW